MNLLSGVGTRRDPGQHTRFGGAVTLDEGTLQDLYRCNGFARRIIDVPAEDMTRRWFKVEGDTDDKIIKALAQIKAKKAITELTRWSRLHGGAVMFMLIDDGQDAEMPVQEDSIRSLSGLRVYDRHRITWTTGDVEHNPKSPDFGEIMWYTIQPIRAHSQQIRVHKSRLIRMDGEDLPEEQRERNDSWGDSTLQSCFDQLRDLGITYRGASSTISDFVQTVITVKGLTDMIANGKEKVIKQRLEIMDMSRSMLNTILLDSEETYTKHASSISGMADLIDRFGLALASVSGMPYSKLFGETAKGLNSTGDNDIRNYYDDLSNVQEDRVAPACQRLVDVIAMSRNGPFGGAMPKEGYPVEMNPLWQMSEKEEADLRKTVGETDKLYVDMDAVEPDEIGQSRFGGGTWSMETELDDGLRAEISSLEGERRKAELAGLQRAQEDDPEDPDDPDA